jgi:hypothetical protein
MKDITDIFNEGALDELDDLIGEDLIPGTDLKKLIAKIKKEIHIYELEDVQDIFDNYQTISKKTEFDLIKYGLSFSDSSLISNEEFQDISGFSPEAYHFNMCGIENVYLLNIKFREGDYFKWMEYDIQDINQNMISVVSIYHSKAHPDEFKATEEKLGSIVASSVATEFDILFQAVPDKERLYTLSIYRSEGGEGDDDSPPSFDDAIPFLGDLIGIK